LKEKPDLIIVVGDVNATLACALTAAKLHIKVAHIEAGLRSRDMSMPEEINRILTDHISEYLFCPTETGIKNLKKEGIIKNVYNVGDLMYDAFLQNIEIAKKKSKILKTLNLKPHDYSILTLHRAGNVDSQKNLKIIIDAIQKSEEKIIFPIHPRTEKQLKKLKIKNCKLEIIPPLGYIDMLWLVKNSKKVLTDSGGLQKEAYFAKMPCLTLRDTTEWPETLKNGWNRLVKINEKEIIKNIFINYSPKKQKEYFGDGKATSRIIKILSKNIK